MQWTGEESHQPPESTCLVIDDIPGVWDNVSKVLGKGVIPNARCAKRVAGRPDRDLGCAGSLHKVVGGQLAQCPSQAMPCMHAWLGQLGPQQESAFASEC